MVDFEFYPAAEALPPLHFCGIPTIDYAPDGRLLTVWYGGGRDEEAGNYLLVAERAAGGGQWSEARVLLTATSPAHRVFDPCLWRDGEGGLHLFFGTARNKLDEMGVYHTARHRGEAWSKPVFVAPGVALNKPVAAADGAWLLPVAKWDADGADGRFSSRVYRSDDAGRSFVYLGSAEAPEHTCDEPVLFTGRDGRLRLLVRTRYGIAVSVSPDGGRSWPRAVPSGIYGADSRFFLGRLRSGRLLMVNHAPPAAAESARLSARYGSEWYRRTNLRAFLSEDDGASWPWSLPLDGRALVSYPDAAEGEDGVIHIVWDHDRFHEREICHAAVTEAAILAGRPVSRMTVFDAKGEPRLVADLASVGN